MTSVNPKDQCFRYEIGDLGLSIVTSSSIVASPLSFTLLNTGRLTWHIIIITIIIIIIIIIIIKYLYSAQSTICPWRFTLKKIFKKLKVLQHYKKKASRKLHQ